MASFVVGKRDGMGNVIPAERQNGMMLAGDRINKWMIADPAKDADTFFKTIYDEVTSGYGNFEVLYFDEGSVEQPITPKNAGNDKEKDYKYKEGGTDDKKLKVKIEEDKKGGGDDNRMTVVIPRGRGELLVGGYVQTIIEDLNDLGTDEEKKKYLLATIFLSRCH